MMPTALPTGLSPVQVEEFPGLRLDVDPGELGFRGAVDVLNVEFEPGIVRARSGLSVFNAIGNGGIMSLVPFGRTSSSEQVIAITSAASNNLVALDNAGTIIGGTGTSTLTPPTQRSWQTIGTPAASYLYVTDGSGNGKRWDASTWTTVGLPIASMLGLSPTDNRLVTANFNSPVARSRVAFSDPGVPETFQATNYVDLTPGDGEQIMGLETWGNQLFAFKKSKFFVFYGNSSHFAADGTEVDDFNYRTFANGVGLAGWGACAPGPDGVYFLDRSGIYRTTGGPPVKISGALDPFFAGTVSPLFSRSVFDPKPDQFMTLGWVKERLYVTVATQTSPTLHTFVWDPKLDAWSIWLAPNSGSNNRFSAFAEVRSVSSTFGQRDVLMGSSDGTVYRLNPLVSTDNGVAFTTRYRSGYSDFGSPAREKTVRETELVGTGSPSLAWSREYGSMSSAQSVSLGSSRRGLDRSAHIGELLAYQLSGSAPWSVQRLVPMLREVRGVGEETS